MTNNQEIRFCKAPDGARIAIATMGKGPPLLRASHWLSHVEYDARSPVWMPWLRELSRDHTYIRYDQRGCGLSDWSPPSISFEAWVSDLEAVADALGLKQFTLLGMSQGGAMAIAYAVRHPERVSRLVLCGTLTQGVMRRRNSTPEQREEVEMLEKLVSMGWGRDNPSFRQLFTTQFIPDATQEQQQWFNELERISATPENAATIVRMVSEIDVAHLAERVRVPTLVMHARDDARMPFDEGKKLAALIPGARFVSLDSRNHILLEQEPAWHEFLRELRAFLGVSQEQTAAAPLLSGAGLTPSEQQVLALVARGLDNGAIAEALGKSEKTVRNQVSSIFSKLGVRTRAEAIVQARDSGIAGTSA